MNKKNSYFDYAATTPVDPRVFKAMLPYFSQSFGNSMSLHESGRIAREAIEKSRQQVASLINADPQEIIFTSSASESNNTVLKGIAIANQNKGRHIIISPIEHSCIEESANFLQRHAGFQITRLKVDQYGLVNPKDVEKEIKKDTILVSIIHASNEIGTIQPIAEIGRICKKKGVFFHTDCSQSFGKIPIDVKKMNIDLLTASSHKVYGPKGAGLLYVRSGLRIEPLIHGGGQEHGLRASTANTPAIVGFAAAGRLCVKERVSENKRLAKLRDRIIRKILKTIPHSYLNGHPTKRLPNNINFRFDYVEGEAIILMLDSFGIAASTGSACSSAKLEPSHVLLATGLKPEQAHGSLRLSLGRWTNEKEVSHLLKTMPLVIKNLRKISPFKKTC